MTRENGVGYLVPCHSRARGPRKYECICGVVKAGIGSIKFVSRIFIIVKDTTQNYAPD